MKIINIVINVDIMFIYDVTLQFMCICLRSLPVDIKIHSSLATVQQREAGDESCRFCCSFSRLCFVLD